MIYIFKEDRINFGAERPSLKNLLELQDHLFESLWPTWIQEVCSPVTHLLWELGVGEDRNFQKTRLTALKADLQTHIDLELVLIGEVVYRISVQNVINYQMILSYSLSSTTDKYQVFKRHQIMTQFYQNKDTDSHYSKLSWT